jgi:hypothetical protein
MAFVTSRGSRNSAAKYADILRKALLAIFLLGVLGAGIELILLEHYAELAQLIPLGAILVGLAVLAMWFLTRTPVVLRVFQVFMLLFCLVGIVGIYLHYESNVEFELEMNPSAMGWPLIWASLTGAMPALAPGTMIHLGLVGLLYTYRHPVFVGSTAKESKSSEDGVEHEE